MMRTATLIVLCLTVAPPVSSAQPPRVTPPCDRACLEGFVDRYLDAMLANEVSPKLFARSVKFTENGVQLPLGNEGLWFGMSGKGTYKFYVPDAETQQVAFIGTVRENMQSRGANTGDGSINTDFEMRVQGRLSMSRLRGTIGNGNGPVIKIRSGNGRLEIRKG
jgi:hypothetical protein